MFLVFKGCFNKHGCNFDDVSEFCYSGLLKLMVFWNGGYGIITCRFYVGLVILSKFGNSSISMRGVIITSIL